VCLLSRTIVLSLLVAFGRSILCVLVVSAFVRSLSVSGIWASDCLLVFGRGRSTVQKCTINCPVIFSCLFQRIHSFLAVPKTPVVGRIIDRIICSTTSDCSLKKERLLFLCSLRAVSRELVCFCENTQLGSFRSMN